MGTRLLKRPLTIFALGTLLCFCCMLPAYAHADDAPSSALAATGTPEASALDDDAYAQDEAASNPEAAATDSAEAGTASAALAEDEEENARVSTIGTVDQLRAACNAERGASRYKLSNDITITSKDIMEGGSIDVTRTVDINLGDYFIYVDASSYPIDDKSVFRIRANGNLTVNRNYSNLALTGGICGKGSLIGRRYFSLFLLAEDGAQLHLRHNVTNIVSTSFLGSIIYVEGKGTAVIDGSNITNCNNADGAPRDSMLFHAKNGTIAFEDGTVSTCRANRAVFAAGDAKSDGAAGTVTIGEKAAIRSCKAGILDSKEELGTVILACKGGTITLNGEITNCDILSGNGTIAYVEGGGSLTIAGEKAVIKDCSCKDEFGVVGVGERTGGTATASGPAATFTMTGGSIGEGCVAKAMRGMVYAGRGSQVNITGGSITYLDSSDNGCCLYVAPYGTAKVSKAVFATPKGVLDPGVAASVEDGGFVHCLGTLTMEDCTINGKNNKQSVEATHGGIVYAEKLSSISDEDYTCSVTLSNCTLKNGSALDRKNPDEKGRGGGIYCKGATLELRNTTIELCEAGDADKSSTESAAGGGLYVTDGGTATLVDCTVKDCDILGAGSGAGIWVGGGSSLKLSGSTVEGNKASEGYGGGICVVADAKNSSRVTALTLGGKTTLKDDEAKEKAYDELFLDYTGESTIPAKETNNKIECAVQGLADGSEVKAGISPNGLAAGNGNRSITGGYLASKYIELGVAGQQRVLRQDYQDLVVTTADKILKAGADVVKACKDGGEYFLDNDITLSSDETKALPVITNYVKMSTGSHWLVLDTSVATPFTLNGDGASLVIDSNTSGDAAGGLLAAGAKANPQAVEAQAETNDAAAEDDAGGTDDLAAACTADGIAAEADDVWAAADAEADAAVAQAAAEADDDSWTDDAAAVATDANAVYLPLIRIDKGTCTVHAAVKGFTCNDNRNDGIIFIPEGSAASTLVCEKAVITGCAAPGSSLIVARAGTVKMTGSRIQGAAQAVRGSCVAAYGTVSLSAEDTTLRAASGCTDGGCLYLADGTPTLDLKSCTLTGTTVSGNGGAISQTNGTASIANTTISRASASNGGAIYASNLQSLSLSGSTRIVNCTAEKNGGGIFFDSDKAQAMLSLQDKTMLVRNRAAGGAGIAFNANSTSTVSLSGRCRVFNNFSTTASEPCNLYLYAKTGANSALDAALDAAHYPLTVADDYAGSCGITVDTALAKTWPYTLAKVTTAAVRSFAADSAKFETSYDAPSGTLVYRPLAAAGLDPYGIDPDDGDDESSAAAGASAASDAASSAASAGSASSSQGGASTNTGDLSPVAVLALAGCAICAIAICAGALRASRRNE